MKDITFRPLRRIKKTGKITIASYMSWRKVKTADYDIFNLIVSDEYKSFPLEEYVHDHTGSVLFFYDYNPSDIPVFTHNPLFDLREIIENNSAYGIRWNAEKDNIHYNVKGMDCDGVPTLSFFTMDYIAEHIDKISNFQPLTVKMVNDWLGWFLYQLENSNLRIGK